MNNFKGKFKEVGGINATETAQKRIPDSHFINRLDPGLHSIGLTAIKLQDLNETWIHGVHRKVAEIIQSDQKDQFLLEPACLGWWSQILWRHHKSIYWRNDSGKYERINNWLYYYVNCFML